MAVNTKKSIDNIFMLGVSALRAKLHLHADCTLKILSVYSGMFEWPFELAGIAMYSQSSNNSTCHCNDSRNQICCCHKSERYCILWMYGSKSNQALDFMCDTADSVILQGNPVYVPNQKALWRQASNIPA